MNTPQLFHTMTQEERKSGYRVSDSEVVDAIRVLQMYAEQVKDERTKLYFDAKRAGNEGFANKHLERYQAAANMLNFATAIRTHYDNSK